MDFFYRTEDFRPDDIAKYFVETQEDRRIIEAIKQRNPVILVGSRGVGKSFLLRVAEQELERDFEKLRVLPVYLSFNRSSLIQTSDTEQFQHWMLARMCHYLLRALKKRGLTVTNSSILQGIGVGNGAVGIGAVSQVERITSAYENSWKDPGKPVDLDGLPTVDNFLEAIEELCGDLQLSRVTFLIDEAAHVLLPSQQRQFFTLYRDLRSPYLSCNAAVYPGLTSFGDTFQPSHDATVMVLDRDVLAANYVDSMREIVEKQVQAEENSSLLANISVNQSNFAVIAYAASGNPRIMLKTVAKSLKLNSSQVNTIVREYYRTDVWSDHSSLAETFAGHRTYVDWGRRFIEDFVLPEIKKKNDQYLQTDRSTSCYFWVHRDAPQSVREALRLLAYTGIVSEHSTGIRATRAEVGTRYAVNLGCLLALEVAPANSGGGIAKNLTPKRMTEFGKDHPSYKDLLEAKPSFTADNQSSVLDGQLARDLAILDLPSWQVAGLKKLGLVTVGDVLNATEETFKQIHMIGEKRSRRIMNAAIEAVFEYLSG